MTTAFNCEPRHNEWPKFEWPKAFIGVKLQEYTIIHLIIKWKKDDGFD